MSITDYKSWILDQKVSEIEKEVGVAASSLTEYERLSTGILVFDLFLGGGLRPGWYTIYGLEQNGKTTILSEILASAAKQQCPILKYYDYEGTMDEHYFGKICEKHGLGSNLDNILGLRDSNGNYINNPLIRYIPEIIAENFFDDVQKVLKLLPTKQMMGGEWFSLLPQDRDKKDPIPEGFDEKYYKKFKRYRYPSDGKVECIYAVDSYSTMNPRDQDDQLTGQRAVRAAMFANQIPRIKGRIVQKGAVILGVNHLRNDVSGNPYKPALYEMCGEALKSNSDVRIRLQSISLSTCPDGIPANKGDDPTTEKEESIENPKGIDTYKYAYAVTDKKNKYFRPCLKQYFRFWVSDCHSDPRGIDSVYDVYRYLVETGQLKGTRKKMVINLVDDRIDFELKLNWMELKKLVIGTKEQMLEVFESKGITRPFKLRDFCFKQLNPVGIELYKKQLSSDNKTVDDDLD